MKLLDRYKEMSPLPDVGDFIFLFVIYLALFVLPNMLFADGSTGWHLVAGDYILTMGAVPYTDLISYTAQDKAWVAYEWFFDAFIALLNNLGGTNLIAVVLVSILGFIFLYIYDRARQANCNIAVASFLVVVAILVSAMHWLARPHLFEYVGLLVFVHFLSLFYRNEIKYKTLFAILIPTMVFWTNSHPSFALGIIVTGIYLTVVAGQFFFSADKEVSGRARSKSLVLLALIGALSLSTLINPYGIKLHLYILSYLEGQEILKATNEYMSPVFHGGLHATCLEILFVAFIAGLAMKRRIDTPTLLLCLAFGHASLASVRNMPVFAMVATPVIAYLLGKDEMPVAEEAEESENSQNCKMPFLSKIANTAKEFDEQEKLCKMHLMPMVVSLVLVIASLNGGSLAGIKILNSGFDKMSMPVATLDYLKENALLQKRGFNYDNWGGYISYKLKTRVFIDDRADFYGHKLYYDYSKVMATGEGWEDTLSSFAVDWILFPKDSDLARSLAKHKDWRLVKSDQASSLFIKKLE